MCAATYEAGAICGLAMLHSWCTAGHWINNGAHECAIIPLAERVISHSFAPLDYTQRPFRVQKNPALMRRSSHQNRVYLCTVRRETCNRLHAILDSAHRYGCACGVASLLAWETGGVPRFFYKKSPTLFSDGQAPLEIHLSGGRGAFFSAPENRV